MCFHTPVPRVSDYLYVDISCSHSDISYDMFPLSSPLALLGHHVTHVGGGVIS